MNRLNRKVRHRCPVPKVKHFWGIYSWTCDGCGSLWRREGLDSFFRWQCSTPEGRWSWVYEDTS